jgi:RNA polymerase-binding transcription factor DksA
MSTKKVTLRQQPVRRPKTRRIVIAPEWAWHFRTLLALRNHLLSGSGDRCRELVEAMEPPSVHALDWLAETYDHDLALALPANREEALREVNDAILRIEKGTYGRCEATGKPIARSRLRATPWRRYTPVAARRLSAL